MNDLFNDKKKTLGIIIDIIHILLICIWFLKGETKTPNGDVPNPDDPFGDDEDHEKLAALAKSFEEKYVSYFTRLQMDKLMYIYL